MSDEERTDKETIAAVRARYRHTVAPDCSCDGCVLLRALDAAEARAELVELEYRGLDESADQLKRRAEAAEARADDLERAGIRSHAARLGQTWAAMVERAERAEARAAELSEQRDELIARLSPDSPVPGDAHRRVALSRRAWIDAATSVLGDDWNGTPDDLRAALDALRTRLALAEKSIRAFLDHFDTTQMMGDSRHRARMERVINEARGLLAALDAHAGGGT